MQALILVGHGSLLAGSGAAMIRLAARVRERQVAPIVASGFLNYSRPLFAETLKRVVGKGATDIVVQPYFLIPGAFVSSAVPRMIAAQQSRYPGIRLRIAAPFGDHRACAELILKRAKTAGFDPADNDTGLLIIAHGSPDPAANQPINILAAQIEQQIRVTVSVCYLGLNDPLIATAISELAERRLGRIIAIPYFLQLGGHVAEDIPEAIDAARRKHPMLEIILADYLGYDPLLADVIADRVAQVWAADQE